MHHHLTISELANRFTCDEEIIMSYCQQLSIPILHGRVDYTLFETAVAKDPQLKDQLARASF